MCVGSNKGTWALGPKGLTAKLGSGDSLQRTLEKSWQKMSGTGRRGGNGLRIPGASGSGKTGGGSSATATGGSVAVD